MMVVMFARMLIIMIVIVVTSFVMVMMMVQELSFILLAYNVFGSAKVVSRIHVGLCASESMLKQVSEIATSSRIVLNSILQWLARLNGLPWVKGLGLGRGGWSLYLQCGCLVGIKRS